MKNRKKQLCFWVGMAGVLFMLIPYILLGQDAVFTYHDQLDGELIAYLLQAKHLFFGDVLPEFMNGMEKTALIPPAPACVLLFLGDSPFAALVIMQLLGSICGYTGMFLLLQEAAEEMTGRGKGMAPFVGMLTGLLYAYLPFLPVYGLSQYGIPLLLWALLKARKGKRVRTALIIGAVYALNSSLVLVGFGVLGLLAVWIVWERKHIGKWVPCVFLVMLGVYLAENFRLLLQLFGGGAAGEMVSHKEEYVLNPSPLLEGIWKNFTMGGQHSEDYHYLFLAAILAVGAAGSLIGRSRRNVCLKMLWLCVGCNGALALAAGLWDSALGIKLRQGMGAIGAFQLNRLLWIAPALWYFALGCAILLAAGYAFEAVGRAAEPSGKRLQRLAGGAGIVLLTAAVGFTAVKVLLAGNLKPNIQKLRNAEYGAMSFADYYAIGVLEQVRDYIYEATGEEQSEYRVVSLGIDPAAALYHGFYCLDGYSNNYSLQYKHEFREIIAPELAKSEYLRTGFDDWGNRCYLFSAESPGYYTIEKNGFYFQDYSLNTEKLAEMGGKYVLSAAYIQNAQEAGLLLLREEPFETEESYYRIFLYGIDTTCLRNGD